MIEHDARAPTAAFLVDGDQDAIESDPFEEFWRAYPRRVAKASARKAFTAALKKVDATTLIAGAARYGGATAHTEPRYVKHPATWLNGECWADEPDHAQTPLTLDDRGNPIEEPQVGRRGEPGHRLTRDEQIDQIMTTVLARRRQREGSEHE